MGCSDHINSRDDCYRCRYMDMMDAESKCRTKEKEGSS